MLPTHAKYLLAATPARRRDRQNSGEQNDRDKGPEENGPKKNPTFKPSDLHGNQLGADTIIEALAQAAAIDVAKVGSSAKKIEQLAAQAGHTLSARAIENHLAKIRDR
jgi:hypothetical protein